MKEQIQRRWHQIKSLPYLLPTLIRLRYGKERPFTKIPRSDHWESTSAFHKQMLGPLLITFKDWSEKVSRNPKTGKPDPDILSKIKSESLTLIAHRTLALKVLFEFGSLDDLKRLNQFKNWADDCPLISNAENIGRAIETWESLMLEHTWEEIIPGQPRIANLYHVGKHGAPHLLPYKLILNGEPYFRIFGHYYVPKTYLNSKGAKAFFDHLAKTGQLEHFYDREHKETVTKHLLWPIQGKKRRNEQMTILDVGVGDGFVGHVLQKTGILSNDVRLYGLDVSTEKFPQIENEGNYTKLAQINIADTSIREVSKKLSVKSVTDVVLAFVDFWLSHEERKKAYKLIFDLLPEGGTLSFDVHHPDYVFSEPDYRQILRDAGFEGISFSIKKILAKDGGERKVGIVFAFK